LMHNSITGMLQRLQSRKFAVIKLAIAPEPD